jgi:hypothetical protein
VPVDEIIAAAMADIEGRPPFKPAVRKRVKAVPTQNSKSQINHGVSPGFRVLNRDRPPADAGTLV